ncbi:hypothetical protein CU669_19905 [Paramagnetospirillum kuznetsovii]|uniref:Uncharacterized protein n=1 Tax=Paramagnetospirillum kuznetsovii TaxID=2053833 RepID=A0A364NSV5_9PROT|nr:hypothetical protein [Paramagnetospirillum kuznetsovii]RAU20156.1 hypothetical protein CU669_19905 [Paramagnetospirillum kuznetsovii]
MTNMLTVVRSSSGKILLDVTLSDRYRSNINVIMASSPAESRSDGYRFDTLAGCRCMDSADIIRISSSTPEQHIEAGVIAARMVVFKGWQVPRITSASDEIANTALGLLSRLGWPSHDLLVSERHRAVRDWLQHYSPLDLLTDEKLLNTAVRMVRAVLPYPNSSEDLRQVERLLRIFAGSDEEARRIKEQEAHAGLGLASARGFQNTFINNRAHDHALFEHDIDSIKPLMDEAQSEAV